MTDRDALRHGESLRKFRKRMSVMHVDGEMGSGAGTRELPDPHAEQDARWNRYIAAATRAAFPSAILDDSEPLVVLERGEINIRWPKAWTDKEWTVLPLTRVAPVLAFQLQEAAAELRRRELAGR